MKKQSNIDGFTVLHPPIISSYLRKISCELAETDAVVNLKKETGCFVMLCNVAREG